MASSIPHNPTSHHVAALLPKLNDADPDIRFMTLNDLHQILLAGSPTFLAHDFSTCAKLVDGLLQTLNDTHGDVQNQAIKCLGPFVNRAPEAILGPTIDKVSGMKINTSTDDTIPALALRAIVVALPHPLFGVARSQRVVEAYNAISKALVPRLVGRAPSGGKAAQKGMIESDVERGQDSNSLDVLSEVAKCFGSMLQDAEVEALENVVLRVLECDTCGPVMRKKAVVALSTLAPYISDALLARLVSNSIERLRQTHLTNQQRKVYLNVFGSMARSIPQKFGPFLTTLAPFALSPLSQLELDQQREAEIEADGERDIEFEEVREAALAAIESFFQTCADNMQSYVKDVVEAATRFLKYDPTLIDDDDDGDGNDDADDDAAMADDDDGDNFEVEEEFEEEAGFDDEDDISWKVRRGSARVLHALVASLSTGEHDIYIVIVPALLSRFKEREESVRDEVLATLTAIVTKSGSTHDRLAFSTLEPQGLPVNRKRRRGGSDAFATDVQTLALLNGYASPTTPPAGDQQTTYIAKVRTDLVIAAAKLLKQSTPSTRLAAVVLLRHVIQAQNGGLSHNAGQVIDPVLSILSSESSSGPNVASNALRIECLALLRAIAESHSSKALQDHFVKIVPALVTLAKDRYARTASEAFFTMESYIKAFTPPRSAALRSENGQYLSQFQATILSRLQASDADTEVKQRAIQALGLLVGRTAGSQGNKLLNQTARFESQQVILERLRNELTRLAAVRAFETVAVLTQNKADCSPPLLNDVALELGAQLRKSSRSLRGASLSALRTLCTNDACRACLSDSTITALIDLLIPLIQGEDLHMLGPTLIILSALSNDKPQLVATDAVIAALRHITSISLSGSSLEALIACVTSLGRAGSGTKLMKMLLDQGVSGETDVLGRVIGALLVASGDSSPVSLQDFIKELQTQTDEARQCLALSILGEAGLRMGPTFTMKPQDIMTYFDSPAEKVKLAAAVALGRAGAGNVKVYLPEIISALNSGQQYLLLHSVKELLHHSTAEDEVRPLAQDLWEHVISSGQAEDNKIVSAECIGRLAIIDPVAYLPQLNKFLDEANATTRGMVMIALRYVFSDTTETYDSHLQDTINPMLAKMLNDADLDNQRLALSAFNSAFQNKTALVVPSLSELLTRIISATVVRSDLVREVSMGPFKHKVDDGLEIRKSAYETMYVLLENRASREQLDVPALFDRVIAGIADEHEIKIVCCLILSKLISLAKEESERRSETLAHAFRTVLSFKPKDTAVKQELEKLTEHNKAIIRVSVQLNKVIGSTQESRLWRDYFEWMRKEFPLLLKAAEDDAKEMRDR